MNLSLRDIAVRYGRVLALHGIDLDLVGGEVHVLAGPNGAGKSSLLAVLLGLVRPVTGTLHLGGATWVLPRHGTPFGLRRRIGYLPEAVAFSETLTGRQILRFHARARGVPRRTADAVLERVGLGHAARRAVRGYSRGMRQRLGLGIAIVAEPDLLVLDEPTVGLDQEGLGLLWELLATWKAAGRAVVISTHDLALIERRTDHVRILRSGTCIASGSPASLRERLDLPVRVRVRLRTGEATATLAERYRGHLGGAHVGIVEDAVEVSTTAQRVVSVLNLVNGELDEVVATRVIEPGLDEVYEYFLKEAGGT